MAEALEWMDLLESTGALQSGHFLLSSGRHSAQYVQCAQLLERPRNAERAGRALAAGVGWGGVDAIVSPPLGALLIGYEVARHLDVPFLFPERGEDGVLRFRRGFSLSPGQRLGLVEDVITTGRTTGELIEQIEGMGATVAGVAAIIDRSTDHAVHGYTIDSLVRLSIPTHAPDACPLCAAGAELVKPGSRRSLEEVV